MMHLLLHYIPLLSLMWLLASLMMMRPSLRLRSSLRLIIFGIRNLDTQPQRNACLALSPAPLRAHADLGGRDNSAAEDAGGNVGRSACLRPPAHRVACGHMQIKHVLHMIEFLR